MAAIDVGLAATDRSGLGSAGYTYLSADNPANDSGTLDTVEIWYASDANAVKVGTFYGSSTDWTNRDYASIGNVTSGSKQTFSGLSIDVEAGDLIGVAPSSQIEIDDSGYAGVYRDIGDNFGAGVKTYDLRAGDGMSLYATGETASATSIKTLFAGTPIADLAKFNGAAISDYKTINGISNVD